MTTKTNNSEFQSYLFLVSRLVTVEIKAVSFEHAVNLFKDYFGSIMYRHVFTPYNDHLSTDDSEFTPNNFV